MDALTAARRLAHQSRSQLDGVADLTAPVLVARAAAREDVECFRLEASDPLLFGARAMLDRKALAIFIAEEQDEAEAAALTAHELGHLLLHGQSTAALLCDHQDLDTDLGTESIGSRRASAYHARERREGEANLFARELLLPAERARELFLEGVGAQDMARRLVLPLEIVRRQLCEALLLPPPAAKEEESELRESSESALIDLKLDDSQRRAAEHHGSALLLNAGPGTGKTRTLIGRILHLLDRGVDPSSILALTFSNKAAAEMSERLHERAPKAAPRVWTGTFHAFGLELLRRHHSLIGLDVDFRLIDRADALALLEERLPALDLEHFRLRYELSHQIADVLSAISRAKDERVDAAGYERLAQAMAENAAAGAAAARASEVAQIFHLYEALLREKKRVDFGDVIALSARLLEEHLHVRASLRLRHRHVLVDEYQDTNRAGRDLLKQLVGRGERLWVVGDSRQSIYRFRGASMRQIANFERDFPGATRRRLETCYRSTGKILQAVETYGQSMDIEGLPPKAQATEAFRGPGAPPRLIEAEDSTDEIAALAQAVENLRHAGVPWRQQAILCRSHAQLEATAAGLERHGLPILHLGPFFEREEVRNLLSVLSFIVDPSGGALMRLAALPGYAVPLQDVHDFLAWTRRLPMNAHRALDALTEHGAAGDDAGPVIYDGVEIAEPPALSPQGVAGLAALAEHLRGVEKSSSPWQILATYLFDRAAWPRDLMAGERRLEAAAIYQCLAFVRTGVTGGRGWPAQRLLARVRRLAMLGEERHLRQMPRESLDVNALRLLTLHGAKGLEFEAVHLPGWVRGQVPHRYRPPRCPSPPGMLEGEDEMAAEGRDADRKAHDGDEQCLAFVALSRAQDHLYIYRHKNSAGRRRRPSPFLEPLKGQLEVATGQGPEAPAERAFPLEVTAPPTRLGEGDVDLYERCPRRFFYSRLADLAGSRRSGPISGLRRSIYRAIDWLREHPGADLEAKRTRFEEAIQEVEGASKTARQRLQSMARERLDRLRAIAETNSAPVTDPANEPTAPLRLEILASDAGPQKATFETRPILTLTSQSTTKLLFVRPGSSRGFSDQDPSFGLIQEAARHRYGTGGAQVEVLYLSDGKRLPILLPQSQASEHLRRAKAAARGIGERKFEANPDPRRCPRCPYFFLCPTLPAGELRLADPKPGSGETGEV